jgi:hypothetical protein
MEYPSAIRSTRAATRTIVSVGVREESVSKVLTARMAKASGTAFCAVEVFPFLPFHMLVARDHHLSDPVAATDDEILFPEIGEDHFHLAPVVSINRTRGVQDADLVFYCEAAARPHLGFIADWQGNGKPRGDESRLTYPQNNLPLHSSIDVHASSMFGGVRRERDSLRRAIDPCDPNLD